MLTFPLEGKGRDGVIKTIIQRVLLVGVKFYPHTPELTIFSEPK
jgi:hypothetical protein